MSELQKQLIRATQKTPPKIILYGSAKVGKTTFAAAANTALIDCEAGAGNVANLIRTPYLATWPEMKTWLHEFRDTPPEGSQGVSIDSIDWMVHRMEEYVSVDLDPKNAGSLLSTMGASHGGYFKARDIVTNLIHRELFPALNAIVDSGRPVILLAHASNTKLTTAEGFEMKVAAPDLPEYILQTFIEWADAVLFASIVNGERTVQTQGTNLILAGNRYDLEPVEPFDWNHISTKIKQHVPRGRAKTSE